MAENIIQSPQRKRHKEQENYLHIRKCDTFYHSVAVFKRYACAWSFVRGLSRLRRLKTIPIVLCLRGHVLQRWLLIDAHMDLMPTIAIILGNLVTCIMVSFIKSDAFNSFPLIVRFLLAANCKCSIRLEYKSNKILRCGGTLSSSSGASIHPRLAVQIGGARIVYN